MFVIWMGELLQTSTLFCCFEIQEVKPLTSKTPQAKLVRHLSESASSDDRLGRTSGGVSEDSFDTKKLPDKSQTHSFILDLEQGSQEALKHRSFGKFDRLPRKERKEKERSQSDERSKLKQKHEKKSEHPVDEPLQKDSSAKVSSEEKVEKKLKVKTEKKTSGSTREGKVIEDSTDEGGAKDARKIKGGSVEKEKIREKEKSKEKEKAKLDKSAFKSDLKQLLRPDSAGSSEDRSDKEPGPDVKKREKHSKEGLKRSKSHSEDRPGDRPKSKLDSEKERSKAESQKTQKPNTEADKDPKKVKPAEKEKSAEKPKVKSKEEGKSSLLVKIEKKSQSPDIRSAGGSAVCKPEAAKEKKKDGNTKEQKKVSEDAPHEKPELKISKKKLEKKDKVPEKKGESPEDKPQKDDELETSDQSAKSSAVEMEDPPKKQHPLQDTNTESDPVAAMVAASFSDDTCDALSDITPEPSEGETESRLREMLGVPAEADALLALMDVCTSAEARLPTADLKEEVTPEMELQDADMKMKEAALTLLSMDPDSTVSSTLIVQDMREESPRRSPDPQQIETTATEEEKQLTPVELNQASQQSEDALFSPEEASLQTEPETAASQQAALGEEEMQLSPVEVAPQVQLHPTETLLTASQQTATSEEENPPNAASGNETIATAFPQDAAESQLSPGQTEPEVELTVTEAGAAASPHTEEVEQPSPVEAEPPTEPVATEDSVDAPQQAVAHEEESQMSPEETAPLTEFTASEATPDATQQTAPAAEEEQQLSPVEAAPLTEHTETESLPAASHLAVDENQFSPVQTAPEAERPATETASAASQQAEREKLVSQVQTAAQVEMSPTEPSSSASQLTAAGL